MLWSAPPAGNDEAKSLSRTLELEAFALRPRHLREEPVPLGVSFRRTRVRFETGSQIWWLSVVVFD